MKKIVTSLFILFISSCFLFGQAAPELLYYKFDGTGTSVPNLASSPPAGTTTATLMGGLTQGPTGQCKGAVIGSGNSSSTDYVNTGYATNLTGSSWTISMWTSNITSSATLFYIFGDASANSFRCFTNGVAGPNNWILRGGGMTDIYVNGGATVAPHVTTFVYDMSLNNVKAYLDGVLVSTVAQGALSISGAGPFKVIGYASNVGAPAGGLLDEFRMYNRALSAAEVAQLASPPASYSSFNVSACTSYTVPSGTATYTTSGTYMDTIPAIGGCADSIMTINATINPLPTVTASSTASAVCAGNSVTLTGGGATSYTWDNSVTDGVSFVPASTITYMVTGTDANGCSNTATTTVTVNPLPTVTANSTSSAVCAGNSVTLTGGGATSYTWDNSVMDGVSFVPASTITYMVTGTDANGCSNTATTTVTVNPLPTVTANSTSSAVCAGNSVTLTGGGATSYTWDNSVMDGVSFVPASTITYMVTGMDGNGCTNTASTTVTVNPLPTVTGTAASTTVCVNDAAVTLTGTPVGGTWSGAGVTGSSFSPTSAGVGAQTVTYSFTDVNGCSNTASFVITVNACTGVEELTSLDGIHIYPNPNNGVFTFTVNENAADLKIVISDLQGRVVYSSIENNVSAGYSSQIDLQTASTGMYLMQVTANGRQRVEKISVQK